MTILYISPSGSYVSSEDAESDINDFFAQSDDFHRVEMPEDTEQDMDEFVDEFIRKLHY